MGQNGSPGHAPINIELDASEARDWYLQEHSEFYDPTITLVNSESPALDFQVEVLRGGAVRGSATAASGGFCKVEVGGTHPPTALPSVGPSFGFRITNTSASRGAFVGAVAWTFGRTR